MIIDTLAEWVVIAIGLMLMLFVIVPGIPIAIGQLIKSIIPHPSVVNDWLNRWGL